MVHPGEAQVFEGQGPEALHGRGHRQASGLNLLQQLLQNFAIHGSFLNRDRRESQIYEEAGRDAGAFCEPPVLKSFFAGCVLRTN